MSTQPALRWRVIARISLTKDKGSALRNQYIKPRLEGCGMRRTKTGTWESSGSDPRAAAKKLPEVVQKMASLTDQIHGPIMNHLWLYIDRKFERHPRRH